MKYYTAKQLLLSRRGLPCVLGSLLLAAGGFTPLAAAGISKTEIQQNQADQTEVRNNTAAVVAQVQGLIDELAANGISGDDIKVLQTTKAVLNNLSAKEMARVIASLQKAVQATGTKTGQQNVVEAYAGQEGIILQFRQILKEYEERQAAYELPMRFKELSDRQTDTMRTTAEVAAKTAGKNQTELSTMDSTTQQIVQADQDALAGEVALAQQQLDKAVQGSTNDDEGKAMQQAQQDLKGGELQKALTQADNELKAGQLLKAINDQKAARDELRRVAKDLNPPTDAVQALMAVAADLAKLIDEQKDLLGQTDLATKNKVMVDGLNDKQAVLVDKADLLQQDMQSLSPGPSALVKQSIDPMQVSRFQLRSLGGFPAASNSEQQAIAKLEDAQKQLQQQLADAEKAEEEAEKDPVAKLQDLQKQIQAAMAQQQQVTKQTDQADNAAPPDQNAVAQAQQQQAQLQTQTAALQQDAQPVSLPASQALANAASQMAQAQQAMADPANAAAAAADQQAAQAALAQANQAVGQQIAADQQADADPAALAAAADALQQAQDQVSSAIADSTPAAGATPAAAATPAADAPSMAQAAAALAAAAADTQAAAADPGLPAAAADAVADAQKDIGAGEADAAKGDAPGTAAAAAAAQGALAQAQAAVAVAEAGMPGAPGPPGPPGPPMPGMPSMAQTPPGPDMPSLTGAKTVTGGSTDKGILHSGPGGGTKFLTVQGRQRFAIGQSQAEKRPQEYAPLIDQYMKNLADQSTSSAQ